MSIRRVSDLPQVTRSSVDRDCFANSFLEISYLSSMQDQYRKYESSKVKVWDLVSATAEVVLNNPTIHGNVYINPELSDTNPEDYEIDIRAKDIRIWSDSHTYIRNLSTENFVIQKDYDISQTKDYDGVNFKLLKDYVESILGNQQQAPTIPLLTFIFSDHEISSPEWKLAGTTFNIEQYGQLKSEILGPDGKLKSTYRQEPAGGDERDTWYYTFENNSLTLPKANCFLRISDSTGDNIGKFQEAEIPNISGQFFAKDFKIEKEVFSHCDQYVASGPYTPKTESSSKGYLNGGETRGGQLKGWLFDASKCSKIYKNNATTVSPDSMDILVYFYVGPQG